MVPDCCAFRHRVELEGLDFATNEAMLAAVAEVAAAEKAMIK